MEKINKKKLLIIWINIEESSKIIELNKSKVVYYAKGKEKIKIIKFINNIQKDIEMMPDKNNEIHKNIKQTCYD